MSDGVELERRARTAHADVWEAEGVMRVDAAAFGRIPGSIGSGSSRIPA
jgi:hypothetical protein